LEEAGRNPVQGGRVGEVGHVADAKNRAPIPVHRKGVAATEQKEPERDEERSTHAPKVEARASPGDAPEAFPRRGRPPTRLPVRSLRAIVTAWGGKQCERRGSQHSRPPVIAPSSGPTSCSITSFVPRSPRGAFRGGWSCPRASCPTVRASGGHWNGRWRGG